MKWLWVSSARIVGNPPETWPLRFHPHSCTPRPQLSPAGHVPQVLAVKAELHLSPDFGLLY
jgi:hypothetical protein